MDTIDAAMLILRVWLALVIVRHGVNHGRNLEGTASWFASKGFRSPETQARISAVGEIAIGLGLLVGLLTSFAAAGLIAIMFVAFWAIHRFAGFFVFARPDEGYEYVSTLAVAAFVLAIVGPGRFSLDHLFGLADRFDGWAGAVVALAGIVAASAQLAAFWRRPETS